MSSEYASKRIVYYDLIRAFAIFGVVACHCFVGIANNTDIFNTLLWFYSLFLYSLREVCVPLFVCVSGALLITKRYSLTDFIKKRFIRVVIPYIFWAVMFIASSMIFLNIHDPTNLIYETFSVPPLGNSVFLWFVQMILVVYVVIFALNKLIERNDIFLKLALVFSIVFIVLRNFGIIPSYPMPYKYIHYSAYAVLGYYLATYDLSSNSLVNYLKLDSERFVQVFFILSILLYLWEINSVVSLSLGSNSLIALSQFSFLNVALVISVFLFFRFFADFYEISEESCIHGVGGKVVKAIFSISYCSYGIYLSHLIVINFFTYVIQIHNYFAPAISATLVLILTLIISWIIVLLMSKIPGLKMVSGR